MRRGTDRGLQEYLEVLADGQPRDSAQRARDLITSYAEVQFKRAGGSRCQVCRASVRHVLPVKITRGDGTVVKFTCMCHRCLQGERATATAVEIKLGRSNWVLKKPEPEKRKKRA